MPEETQTALLESSVTRPKLLSVVVPFYNEQETISIFMPRLLSVLAHSELTFELIAVNDGSFDGTDALLRQYAQQDRRIKYLSFTRNFGHQMAITAGLEMAKGDVILTMDGDLQDPPELIPNFIAKWHKGAKVVFGRRTARKENWLKKGSAALYYYLLYHFSEIKIKGSIGDFRLIDRQVLEQLKQVRNKSKYLRGLISYLGYDYAFVDYSRPERIAGKTKFSLLKMLRLAMDGLLNFSLVPIRLGLFLGIFTIAIGFMFLAYIIADTLIFDTVYPLYKWISVVTFIFIGFLFVLIWILAEYIGMMREQWMQQPPYVIKSAENLDL